MAIDVQVLRQLPKEFFREFKALPLDSERVLDRDMAVTSLALEVYYNQDYYWIINQYNGLAPLPYIKMGTKVKFPSKFDVEALITKWYRKQVPTNSVRKVETNL